MSKYTWWHGLALAVLIPMIAIAEQANPGRPDVIGQNGKATITESTGSRMLIRFDIGDISMEEVDIGGVAYKSIHLGDEGVIGTTGEPELPFVYRHIRIGNNDDVQIRVLSSDYHDLTGIQVAPSKGLATTTTADQLNQYIFGKPYQSAGWFPSALATLGKPFVMRGVRGIPIRVNAIQHHPTEQLLRVYTSITVEVSFVGQPGAQAPITLRTPNPIFDKLYKQMFLNYDNASAVGKWSADQSAAFPTPQVVDENGEMLVIVYDDYYQAMLPFVEWKQQRGIKTTMVKVSGLYQYQSQNAIQAMAAAVPLPDTFSGYCCYGSEFDRQCAVNKKTQCTALGGTWTELPWPNWTCESQPDMCPNSNASANIKAYLEDYYLAHDSLVYVLLVGDSREISPIIYDFGSMYGQDLGTGPSDFCYSLLDGTDDYPDVIVGRFSAESVADVETQVRRTLEYEKSPQGVDWYTKATGIARPDHVPHMNTIRDHLIGWGFQVDQLYCTINDCPNAFTLGQTLTTNLNTEGRSIINYCHHGDATLWGTGGSGTIYSVSNVFQLQNVARLPVITSIACLAGKFDEPGSIGLGEAWLRARNAAGEPVGAIGTFMASISVFALPMYSCQRQINYDLMNGRFTTFGAACYDGALQIIRSGGSPLEKAMNLFGDPSLQVRTANPVTITATHVPDVAYNASTFAVHVESGGVPKADARCALYSEGNSYGSAFSDANGNAVINLTSQVLSSVPLTLSVTGRNTTVLQEPVQVVYDLVIGTTPLTDTKNIATPYPVLCKVYSGSALQGSPVLKYQLNSDTTSMLVSMTATGNPDEFTGSIPAQPAGTTIVYQVGASNVNNNTYTTPWYTFHTIDYGFKFGMPVTTGTEQYNYPVWFDMTITNDGVLDDVYQLTALGEWTATFWNQAGTTLITQTPNLVKDAVYHCKLKIVVSSIVEGEQQNTQVTVTSVGKPTLTVSDTVSVVSEGQPLSIPFSDAFPTAVLDESKWIPAFTGMTLTNTASYAAGQDPEPYTAFLYGASMDPRPSSLPQGIGLNSRRIDLNGQFDIFVKYWYQQGQLDLPEVGDYLVVEYIGADGLWRELCRHAGTGSGESAFTMNRVKIPTAGLHSRFQLRFQSDGIKNPTDPFAQYIDCWFVDNVSVHIGIPQPPQLVTPFNNSSSTNNLPNLTWSASALATSYEVVIDNNPDFSSPHGSAIVTATSWVVSPALTTGTYYWRVRAKIEDPDWSSWSTAWKYTRTDPPGPKPSCPVLFAYDGHEFQQENPLLTACELTNYTQKVTDHYQVKRPVAAQNGVVAFELRELEDETTYLDDIELITVDHYNQNQIGCSVDGMIFAYRESVAPISVIDQDGVDWTAQLSANDDVYFHAGKPGYLLLTFPMPVGKASFSMTSEVKQKCYVDSKEFADRADRLQPLNEGLKVSHAGEGEEWTTYPDMPPRTNPTTEFLEVDNKSAAGSQTTHLRISWQSEYIADVVNMVSFAEENPVIGRHIAQKAELRSAASGRTMVPRLSAYTPLELRKGDVLSLRFRTGDVPEFPLVRDYIVKATGRYEPDRKVHSTTPDRFRLFDNYPNPFNPSTTISFSLPTASDYKLTIYNVTGQVVKEYTGSSEAGQVSLTWDASGVASGVYLYRLKAGSFTDTKKMVLLK